MRLIEILAKKGIIDKKQVKDLDNERMASKKTEENFFLDKKIIDEETLLKIKSEIYKVPFLQEAEGLEITNEVLLLIPEESAKFYRMIPLKLNNNILEVGMVDPVDSKAKEALVFLARQNNFKYKIFLITENAFSVLAKQYRNLTEEVGEALEALESETPQGDFEKIEDGGPVMERLAEEAPIIKMVSVILRHAVEGDASDIHIEPTPKKTRVRFRLDGVLYSSLFLPIQTHASIVARIKILSNLRIDETRIPQDGRFTAKVNNREIDFRISTFPVKLGEKVVIRVLDPTEGLKGYKELGISGKNEEYLEEAVKKPFGLILATGPTGSGKTTTLYALLQILNQEGVNIVTLEDPIEYFLEGVNQSQVKPEIGYTFASGLRSIVRQDPDIIMVGEIRDEESASLVTHAALTGHIVLSTLHTNTSTGVIPRLIDMKIKPFLLPPTLNIAIGQRLARALCPHCREKVKPSKEIEKLILKELEEIPDSLKKDISKDIYIYQAKGCKKCNYKGEKGRVGVYEIMKMTDEIAEIIMQDPSEHRILKKAKEQGMITMRQDGLLKALKGDISIEEVLRISED